MAEKMTIPEKAIVEIKGRAIPKPASNQNTDDIVPARFLKEVSFKRMGDYVYYDERFKDGKSVPHPFNDSLYSGATILLAGENYGCGSSREHAPQALYRFGIRVIVAPSFAEIFAGNSASIGLVCATISQQGLAELVSLVNFDSFTNFLIDLSGKKITSLEIDLNKHTSWPVDIPEGRKQAFLDGTWDAMSLLARNQEAVEAAIRRIPYFGFK